MIDKDKRKNNIGDRVKHIAIAIDAIEEQSKIIARERLLIDKQFQLLKADFNHLIDDIYGINEKEDNK